MTRELTTKSPSGRVRRQKLGVRNKLSLKERDPNYHYRIVNDVEGRIDQLTEDGWEVVRDAKVGDKRIENSTGVGAIPTISVGQGMKAVVMRIKKEWYDEDRAAEQAQITAQEQQMRQDARRSADYGNIETS